MKNLYKAGFQDLRRKMEEIRTNLLKKEKEYQSYLDRVQPHYQESARNLVHYLALRTVDLRPVQSQLFALGISSISHAESTTLANVENVLDWLDLLNGNTHPERAYVKAEKKLQTPFYESNPLNRHNQQLFGSCKRPRGIKIMVTLPTEAASDRSFVKALLLSGMNIARINCSHDDPAIWESMIHNVNSAVRETNYPCRVYMDLAGPKLRTGEVGELSKKELKKYLAKSGKKGTAIILRNGDMIHLHRKPIKGKPAEIDDEGNILKPAKVATTLPEIFEDVKVGELICFDDGNIIGRIEKINKTRLDVRVTQANPLGSRLRSDKGINLPETELHLPSLTEEDYTNLPFIAKNADMVGYSFVRTPEDVEQLQKSLKKLGRQDIGIILKIETKKAFNNLPQLLLTAMRNPKVGVMIARGDLAVEVGFERIAEVQEELLWVCEAAHIPVIWATQVLEKLAKEGIATRAEITDAAMSGRAECVMLNKGPFILNAVSTLDNIIQRMSHHQRKRFGQLRPLNVASSFFETASAEVPADKEKKEVLVS
jgi:pyruvate kinase